jgi:hypothetical protein
VNASKAKTAQRVEEFVRIKLDGAEPFDLRPYVSEQQAVPGSPWELAGGKKPLSDRQIRRYAAAADRVIAESCRTSRKRLMRRHLAQRRNLFAKAVNSGDVRAALACLADEAKLLNLYDPPPAPGPKADPPAGPADVVKLLAARLAAIDQGRLPAGEQARLVAALADAMLRAVGVADLAQQIADLSARLDELTAVAGGRGR